MSNGSEHIKEPAETVMSDAEKAWRDWRAPHPSGIFNVPYVAFMAGWNACDAEVAALRERLAAAEALIWEMGDATDIRHGGKLDRLDRIAMLAAGYPRSEGGDRV